MPVFGVTIVWNIEADDYQEAIDFVTTSLEQLVEMDDRLKMTEYNTNELQTPEPLTARQADVYLQAVLNAMNSAEPEIGITPPQSVMDAYENQVRQGGPS